MFHPFFCWNDSLFNYKLIDCKLFIWDSSTVTAVKQIVHSILFYLLHTQITDYYLWKDFMWQQSCWACDKIKGTYFLSSINHSTFLQNYIAKMSCLSILSSNIIFRLRTPLADTRHWPNFGLLLVQSCCQNWFNTMNLLGIVFTQHVHPFRYSQTVWWLRLGP